MTHADGNYPQGGGIDEWPDTDDADWRTVLKVVRGCALAWEPPARLLGNVRAGDITRAIDTALAEPAMSEWQPPETAPRDGKPFLITTAGPEVDMCSWVQERGAFVDYFFKQAIAPIWPYMVAWKPLGEPAAVGDTEVASRAANGWTPAA